MHAKVARSSHETEGIGRPCPLSMNTTVIVIGGPPGTGKTTHAKRLSTEYRIPCLGSDAIGQIIGTSRFVDTPTNAVAVAYDVVFGLCDAFLHCGVSVILDLNMAWEFQWQHLEALRASYPHVRFVTIILRAPRDVCLERIRQRHVEHPDTHPPAEVFMTTEHILQGWAFLERLDKPGATFIDAAQDQESVYREIMQYVKQAAAR